MGEDFMQILGVLLEELKKEEVELAATMTKKIWLHLNTKHFFFLWGRIHSPFPVKSKWRDKSKLWRDNKQIKEDDGLWRLLCKTNRDLNMAAHRVTNVAIQQSLEQSKKKKKKKKKTLVQIWMEVYF